MSLSEDTCPTIEDDFIPSSPIEFSAFGSTLNHISGEEWTQRKILQTRPLEVKVPMSWLTVTDGGVDPTTYGNPLTIKLMATKQQ